MKYKKGTLFINTDKQKVETFYVSFTEISSKYAYISDIVDDNKYYKVKFSKSTIPTQKSNHIYFYYTEGDFLKSLSAYRVSLKLKLENL
jgi:hypothetical protein